MHNLPLLYKSTVIQYSATKPVQQTHHKAVQSRTSHAIEATEDQERCQLLRSVSAKNHPTPMLYSIPTQEVQLYSFVDYVQIRFKALFAA